MLIDEVLEAVGDGTLRVVSSNTTSSKAAAPAEDIGNFFQLTPGFDWAEDVEAMDSDSGEDESSDDEVEVSLCLRPS